MADVAEHGGGSVDCMCSEYGDLTQTYTPPTNNICCGFFFFKTIYIPVQPCEETLVDTHMNGVSESKFIVRY